MPAKKRLSRRKYTEAQVIGAIRKNRGLITQTAETLGCTSKGAYDYVHRSAAIRTALEEAREAGLDRAEAVLFQLIDEKNVAATIFYLKCVGKKRGYIERQERDVNPGDRPVEFTLKLGDRVVKED